MVALVITIVILIILATITINVAFGEGGLIERAQQAKELTEQTMAEEAHELNMVMSEYANMMAEDSEVPEPNLNEIEEPEPEPEPQPGDPIDGTLAVGPQVAESGMIPVKYVENVGWVETTAVDEDWYDYNAKKWANVVLGDASFTTSGEYEVLNENATYSMLVWIPRYAYQITSMYHQNGSGGGNINIVFLDTENKDKDGTDYSSKTTYPSASTGSGMTDFVVHPAFTFGTDELAGFWVGKYETSNTAGYGDSSSTANNANLQIQIKAGVQSWRRITVSEIHTTCTGMNNSGNSYKLSTDDSVVDPHMMKNTEWGAVAYLAQSKYGKGSEVAINSNGDFYTGGGSSVTSYLSNKDQSTTGDETGIYDMSGCAWEYVAGYLQGGIDTYGSELMQADQKYSDVYTSYTAPSASTKLYGDAVYETSSSVSSPYTNSWYSDYSYFLTSVNTFFVRGGHFLDGSEAGLFYFNSYGGSNYSNGSFRVVVPVL